MNHETEILDKQQGPNKRWIIMTAVFIATFMTSVEVTIVTTALPSIISELHELAFQSWIYECVFAHNGHYNADLWQIG